MGEYVNQHGYTCYGVRLAGHATNPQDMIRSTRTDWMASVEDAYYTLKHLSDRIFLIGLSMGGILSFLMSTQLDVIGIVAMATPYKLPNDPRLPFINLISRFISFMPKSKELPGSGWSDPQAWKDHISYPQNPIRSIGELNLLLGEMRTALPRVTAPVLLIHSKDDKYVAPENMELIYDGLINASEKAKVYISGSGHVVTRDAARDRVFKHAVEFIRNVESRSK